MNQDEGPDLITMFALMQLLALPPEERKARVEDDKPADIVGVLQDKRRVEDTKKGISRRWLLHLTPKWNEHDYLGVSCFKRAGDAEWTWYAALVHADTDTGCDDTTTCPMTDLTASVYHGESPEELTLADILPKVGVKLAHPEDEVIKDAGLRLN